MMTFLTILFVLICINAVMMLPSIINIDKAAESLNKGVTNSKVSKIYPIDLFDSNYKKAV